MPSNYAHYRFGTSLLTTMPGDMRRTIQRFRRLFDVGLHGPDIFYYHSFLFKTNPGFLGIKFHEQTGREFFQRVCRAVRLDRSEAAQAYLYGVFCHYCLDSAFREFLTDPETQKVAPNIRIETEFDRFLLELDGRTPPHTQDLSNHIQLTPGECATVSKFYPPSTANNIKESVRNMAATCKFLAMPQGAKRTVIEKSIGIVASEYQGMIMTTGPNPQCAHLDEELLALYNKATADFPEMLSQLLSHMTYSAPFGAEFDHTF